MPLLAIPYYYIPINLCYFTRIPLPPLLSISRASEHFSSIGDIFAFKVLSFAYALQYRLVRLQHPITSLAIRHLTTMILETRSLRELTNSTQADPASLSAFAALPVSRTQARNTLRYCPETPTLRASWCSPHTLYRQA